MTYSHSSVAFTQKLLKLRIPQVAQTTVLKMCITFIKSEKISIPNHKNSRISIKSQKKEVAPLFISKIFYKLIFFNFELFFFINRISLKDLLSTFPKLFIYFAAMDSDRYTSCLERKEFVS